MIQILVDTPTGEQRLLEVHETGSYFEPARILWSTLDVAAGGDGPLPDTIQLGGMVKSNGSLAFSQSRMAKHVKAATPAPKEMSAQQLLASLTGTEVAALLDHFANNKVITPERAEELKGGK